MTHANPFVAELLERGAAGFAGYATRLLLDRNDDLAKRCEPDGFATWKAHLTQRIIELAAALAAGERQLFVARLHWSRKAFEARGSDPADLKRSLEALREVMSQNMPTDAAVECNTYIDAAIAIFDQDAPNLDDAELNPNLPHDRTALLYLQQVLEGNVAAAIEVVKRAADSGLGAAGVYLQVLLPAQREIGRLWHLGDVSISEEHLVSATTQRTMSLLTGSGADVSPNGKTMVAAAVAGNAHDIGLRAVADLFQLQGWRAIFIGSDVPAAELPNALTYFDADVLLLGATLSTQIQKAAETIRIIRDRCERDVKIIVGGAAFDEAPDLWRRVGGDGYSPTIDGAVELGGKLAGLRAA
jgi:methanogenic corrinoid protein MtbC1